MTRTNSTPQNMAFWPTLRADLRNTFGDAKRTGYRRTISQTLDGLESYYLPDSRRRELAGMNAFRRFFYRCWWLFKALFYKLAPGRRVLLLIGLLAVTMSYGRGGPQAEGSWGIIGVACVLLVLMLELREKLVARDELAEGRAIQQALLPKTTPSIPGFEIWLDTTPANDVGGDIVDVLQAEDGRSFVLLGDVAGKGLGAALLAARLQATFRALAPDASSLEQLGDRLNRIFHRDGPSNRFATAVAIAVRPGETELRLLNAGHPPPLLIRDGRAEPLAGGGPAFGIVSGAHYTEQAVTLRKGDTLVVYSDGVTEAMNSTGEFFGDERLLSTLLALAGSPPAEIGRGIQQAVRAFEGGERPHDDLSLILIRAA